MSYEKVIITISGYHGVGKTTVAKLISQKLGIRHISSGLLFRKIAKERGVSIEKLSKMAEEDPTIDRLIDDRLIEEASKGGIVADALLAGWLLKDIATLKVWLKAPLEVRVKRIAEREGKDYETAYKETLERELSEKKRFKLLYNIDLDDLSIYDYVISTHMITITTLKRIVALIVKDVVKRL
ncbi:MAG: AAA family ATPase [Candidatus Geothermarchaeota archaeon]